MIVRCGGGGQEFYNRFMFKAPSGDRSLRGWGGKNFIIGLCSKLPLVIVRCGGGGARIL